jgi:diguanylate cyclase (GGDEF)-like protein
LLDIDDFKAVNTEFGYNQADQILREFAEFLVRFSRQHGICVLRYKYGDEFLFIMEDTAEKRASDILGTLQDALRVRQFATQGKTVRIGFSAGRSTLKNACHDANLPRNGATIQELLNVCERNLLASKAKRISSNGPPSLGDGRPRG